APDKSAPRHAPGPDLADQTPKFPIVHLTFPLFLLPRAPVRGSATTQGIGRQRDSAPRGSARQKAKRANPRARSRLRAPPAPPPPASADARVRSARPVRAGAARC